MKNLVSYIKSPFPPHIMLKFRGLEVFKKYRPLQAFPLLLRPRRRGRLASERGERIGEESHKVLLRPAPVIGLLLFVEVVEVFKCGKAGHFKSRTDAVVRRAVHCGQFNLRQK